MTAAPGRPAQWPVPQTRAAGAALEVAEHFYPPSLLNHCLRCYHFATADARRADVAVDQELLFVAALLHDLGLVPEFDAAEVSFEVASGKAAWVFAAAAGWPTSRRAHLEAIIVGHMRTDDGPEADAERHFLKRATGLDIIGRDSNAWPEPLLISVLEAFPRLDLTETFSAHFEDQAARKPASAAANTVRNGLLARLEDHPLNHLVRPDGPACPSAR